MVLRNKNPHIEVTFWIVKNDVFRTRWRTFGTLYAQGNPVRSQQLRSPVDATYEVSDQSPGEDFLPETDTFDTWYSSGQWYSPRFIILMAMILRGSTQLLFRHHVGHSLLLGCPHDHV